MKETIIKANNIKSNNEKIKNTDIVTLRQISSICGIGGELIKLTINTKDRSTSMVVNSDSIKELFSDDVLNGIVTYITVEDKMIKITVVAN